MGLLDNLKAKLGPLKDKAGQHGDKMNQGVDKAGKMADSKTQGKYSSQIDQGTGRAKDALGRMSEGEGKDRGTDPM